MSYSHGIRPHLSCTPASQSWQAAKANATRTALLIGYAHRKEWVTSREPDNSFDQVLSA